MALLKTGTKYPITSVSSFEYECSNDKCDYRYSFLDENHKIVKCPTCGSRMVLKQEPIHTHK